MKFEIAPMSKPRMTQRDKWQLRPCVERYWKFCDHLRFRAIYTDINWDGVSMHFHMPMPASWTRKKRAEMKGKPHRQRPDIDNLVKAVFDALLKEDSYVYHINEIVKVWSDKGSLELHWMDSKDKKEV